MVPGTQIAAEAKARLLSSLRDRGTSVEQLLGATVYHERKRLSRGSGGVRIDADRRFVASVERALAARSRELPLLLEAVVSRYASEIEGSFSPKVYGFATRVLPLGITALLNGTTPAAALLRVSELPRLGDRLVLSGEIEQLRALVRAGTVVLAPTHVSNLDSLLLGYGIHKLGLPPFAYGAGLNLFESRVLGFFMHNLGAYAVDRSKSDPLYRELLKGYATVALERGQHQLFFPGGTRSRSFAIERRLKKGLLGTTLAAFSNNLAAHRPDQRVFVVPVTLSYPLVLEASSLIDEHLDHEGRERYLAHQPDEPELVERWLTFLRKVLALDLDVHMRIGAAFDPFGCAVNGQGRSLDPRGREIDASGYLRADGELVADPERDRAYTELLERALLRSYARNNVVPATWLLAYVAFELLRKALGSGDALTILRHTSPGAALPRALVLSTLERACTELRALADAGDLVCAKESFGSAPQLLQRALDCFATYHNIPVLEQRGDDLIIGDPRLLYFYRNRLDGYGLLDAPSSLLAVEP